MARNNTQTPPAYQKYAYGALSQWLLDRGESEAKYSAGALRTLAGREGLNLSDDARGFVEGATDNIASIAKATKIYNKSFYDNFDHKVSDITSHPWYAPALQGLSKESLDLYKGTFSGLGDLSVNKLEKAILGAQAIASVPEEAEIVTQQQRIEAQKILTQYRDAYLMKKELDNFAFEKLRPKAVEATRIPYLEDRVKKLYKLAA